MQYINCVCVCVQIVLKIILISFVICVCYLVTLLSSFFSVVDEVLQLCAHGKRLL